MADETNAAPATNAGGSIVDTSQTEAGLDVANAGNATPVTKEEIKEARKFKLKYGKEEREVDEATAIAMAQKGWAADEKFQKASKKEKELIGLIDKFKNDDEAFDAFVRKMGKDPIEIYKRQLAKELQRKVMTPEQRELADAKARLAEFEGREKKRAEDEHKAKVDSLQTHYEEEYDKQMSKAILDAGLPKTPKTIKRLAQLAYKNLEMGLDLPWNTLTDMVKEEYRSDMKELFGASEADKLVELFGPDIAKKLASGSLKARVADPEPVTKENRQAAKPKESQDVPKYATEEDWETKMKKFKSS